MKKLFLILIIMALGCLISAAAGWMLRTQVCAHWLTKELNVPASIGSINILKGGARITDFWLGTRPKSRSKTSFLAETIDIQATKKTLLADPVTIDSISIKNLFIGIEFYDSSGEKNNWTLIAGPNKTPPKKTRRDYLIKTLSINNLVAEVTKADGSVKQYPMIDELTLHNISSTSGFPVREIERAVLNQIMKDVFQKLNLDMLLKSIDPFQYAPGSSPWRLLPDLFSNLSYHQKLETSSVKL